MSLIISFLLNEFTVAKAQVTKVSTSEVNQTKERAQQLQQQRKKILFAIDSLRNSIKRSYEFARFQNFQELGKNFERLGEIDSALKYFSIVYLNTRNANLDYFLPTYSAISFGRLLKRKGYFKKAIEVLEGQPDNKIENYRSDLRMERFLLLSNCMVSSGEIVRAYACYKQAKALINDETTPLAKADLNYTLGLILGTTENNKDITEAFRQAMDLGTGNEAYPKRIDYLLCNSSCNVYGTKGEFADSLFKAAEELVHNGLDSSYLADLLELKFRTVYHRKKFEESETIAAELVKTAQKFKLRYLEGIGYLYKSRNGPSQDFRGLQCDTAIAIFREVGHFNALKIALHERFTYFTDTAKMEKFILKHFREHYQMVEQWENQQTKVDYDYLKDVIAAQEEDLNQASVGERRMAAIAFGLGGAVLSMGLFLFLFRGRYQKSKALQAETLTRAEALGAENKLLKNEMAVVANKLSALDELVKAEASKQESAQEQTVVVEVMETRPRWEVVLENLERLPVFFHRLPPYNQENWPSDEENLQAIYNLINLAIPKFGAALQKQVPELTPYEQKLCLLLVAEIDTKTIALMLDITEPSLLNRRSTLRKKLNIGRERDLNEYLKSLTI